MIVRVTWRVPIPLAVLVVIDCAGFAVSRVRGTFGSEKRPSYADGQLEDTKPFNPKLTTTLPAVVGNSGVQGDSNSIGCRIMVDGKVNAEKVSNEVDAYTRCLVKAA